MNKFTLIGKSDSENVVYKHKMFEKQDISGTLRYKICTTNSNIDFMLDWINEHSETFGVLYVLNTSHTNREDGRYQSSEPCNKQELIVFLNTFKEFFQNDGRHHIWLFDLETDDYIIYDNHEIIYAYGDLDKLKSSLIKKGFIEDVFEIPCPHSYHFNEEFD